MVEQQQLRTNRTSELLRPEVAIEQIASNLEGGKSQVFKTGSFWEFTRDIWSKGYENPEWFNLWHVGFLAEECQRTIEEGLGYVAVIPRAHFKSTVLGYSFSLWRMLQDPRDSEVLYLSFSDSMSDHHTTEMKKYVRRNPILSGLLEDRSPKADSSFRYSLEGKRMTVLNGGVFSFKRGVHVNGALVADDILKDPDNPMNPGQVLKVEEHFMAESMYIPNKNTPIVIVGTPMLPDDIFAKLKGDERFFVRVLPALDPIPGVRVLAPEVVSEEQLMREKRNRPKAFASERMLAPVLSTDAYINNEDLEFCFDSDLRSMDPYKEHDFESDLTVAGFDVGKKRHPSHLAIFKSKGDHIYQIHESFLDNWDYVKQAKYLNDVAKNFDIDKGYIDGTRGEMEDRGLESAWEMVNFTSKNRRTMAQVFEQYVSPEKEGDRPRLHMIQDERQTAQIVSVNAALEAPETVLGHGDSFWSNALAVLAFHETNIRSTRTIGGIEDFAAGEDSADLIRNDEFPGPGIPTLDYNKDKSLEACPSCHQTSGWVPERGLCLICNHRRE